MKILFFHNGADLYGASRSFLRLCARLKQTDVEVVAVLPCQGPLADALRHAGVELAFMPDMPIIERRAFKSPLGVMRIMWQTPVSVVAIARLLRKIKPDLVHTNLSVLFTPAIAARIMRCHHVWHIRESYAEFGLFWRLYRRFIVGASDRVVAVSQFVADQFPAALRNKVTVIHNGFPVSEFAAVCPERIRAFRKRFGLNGELLVGLVGRIKWIRKGQEFLVEAAAILKTRFPNVKYLLIGSPFPGNEDHLARLLELIREKGVQDRVVYTGDVADIKAAYAALDVSVLASGLPEPFGGVVIESMAMGKPVVGTRIGGTPEQIEDTITGLLVPPRNAQCLAIALAQLLDSRTLRESMGLAGRKRFERYFTFDPFCDKMRRVYKEVTS
jgi:glycosyltransferase involved in cell wall biosynthesis